MSPAETRGLPHGRDPVTADGYARVAVPGAATKMGGNRRRGPVRGLIVTARPRQWIKNVLVIAAAGAAGALGRDDVPLRLTLACAAFCLLASGIYAINDVRDVDEDRIHPGKRFRPIAAGEARSAPRHRVRDLGDRRGTSGVRCDPTAAGAGGGRLRGADTELHAALASHHSARRDRDRRRVRAARDRGRRRGSGIAVALVSDGRDLRSSVYRCRKALGGAAAVRGHDARGAKGAERLYPLTLQLVLRASAALALFAYCVWAFQPFDVDAFPWRPLTIVPFAACLARYALHIQRGEGEAPEDLVLGDRWLSAAGITWVVLFGVSVYGGA